VKKQNITHSKHAARLTGTPPLKVKPLPAASCQLLCTVQNCAHVMPMLSEHANMPWHVSPPPTLSVHCS
jgi:hypothetical protein